MCVPNDWTYTHGASASYDLAGNLINSHLTSGSDIGTTFDSAGRVNGALDGQPFAKPTIVGTDRLDVANDRGRPDWRYSGFEYTGSIHDASVGQHTIAFASYDKSGNQYISRSLPITVTAAPNTLNGFLDPYPSNEWSSTIVSQGSAVHFSGWAADQNASSGSPLQRLEIPAEPVRSTQLSRSCSNTPVQRRIYMDNNATTPVFPEVVAAMQPFWAERFGNASAVHEHGRNARTAIDDARDHVAALLGARASEITFTGSGTESDNLALFGTLLPGQHLITSSIEHHAVLHTAQELERRGVELTVVDPDSNGVVPVESVRAALRPNTAAISLMLANNETGVLQPVQAVSMLAHRHGVLMHTDAVQCCGKLPVSVRELGCDLLSLSAHKMHAPQGVGALWTRRGIPLRPLLHGGPHERQRRAGTENVPGIVAFGEAARLAHTWLDDDPSVRADRPTPAPTHADSTANPASLSAQAMRIFRGASEASPSANPEALQRLHHNFEDGLLRRIPDTTIHGKDVPRLPNTTSVRFQGVDAEALVIALDLKGLSISGGSACTSGAVEPSHVLRSMGLTDDQARSTVRISFSRLTTAAETAAALDLLEATVAHLRSLP